MSEEEPPAEPWKFKPTSLESELRIIAKSIYWVVGILALVWVAWLPGAILRPRHRGHDRSEAVSNARQVGLALDSFQKKYGSFPCEATVTGVMNDFPATTLKLGNASSNDYFRQLIAAGMIGLERPFYTPTLHNRKPDNVLVGSKCLEMGEVAFAYVVSHANCKESDFPIMITPLVNGKLQFDYLSAHEFFADKVVVLWADLASTVETVDKNGHVKFHGKDFFDPSQPYWHGIAPKVAWPE